MPRIAIHAEQCRRCGMCIHICPEGLFVQEKSGMVPRITRKNDCIDCGHCVSVCETGAIEHSSFPPEDFLPAPEG